MHIPTHTYVHTYKTIGLHKSNNIYALPDANICSLTVKGSQKGNAKTTLKLH